MIVQKFQVEGVAIRPGISRNGILYTAEELNKFAPTLSGRPILKDHESFTDNAIGLVEEGASPNSDGVVGFRGWIKDPSTEERIQDGRVTTVSIGATVQRLVKEHDDDEHVKAIGIEGLELSTTPTPGVRGTSIGKSLESMAKNKEDKTIKILAISENSGTFKKFDIHLSEKKGNNLKNEEAGTMVENLDKVKLEEEFRAKVKAEAEAKAKLEEDMKVKIREEAIAEAKAELVKEAEEKAKADKELAEKKATEEAEMKVKIMEDLKKEKEVISETLKEMKGKTEEEIKAKLEEKGVSKELIEEITIEKPESNLHGKVGPTKEEAETLQKEASGQIVVEGCEFGDGFSLWKQPNADGSYNIAKEGE